MPGTRVAPRVPAFSRATRADQQNPPLTRGGFIHPTAPLLLFIRSIAYPLSRLAFRGAPSATFIPARRRQGALIDEKHQRVAAIVAAAATST